MNSLTVGQIVFNNNPAQPLPKQIHPKPRQLVEGELLESTRHLIDQFQKQGKSLNQLMKTVLLNWED